MLIIPAIDLIDGKVVRLHKGEYGQVTEYSDKPADIARSFQDAGASLIHVVDLDGAKAGNPVNIASIEAIRKTVTIQLEVGGGIRSFDNARILTECGVERLVIGTSACEDEDLLGRMVDAYKNAIVIAVDVKNGYVATRGWIESSQIEPLDFIARLEKCGVGNIMYTDVARDGTLVGPNIPALEKVLDATDIPVIASGGVSTMADLEHLKVLEPRGLAGVITGKAIYDKKIDLKKAIGEFL